MNRTGSRKAMTSVLAFCLALLLVVGAGSGCRRPRGIGVSTIGQVTVANLEENLFPHFLQLGPNVIACRSDKAPAGVDYDRAFSVLDRASVDVAISSSDSFAPTASPDGRQVAFFNGKQVIVQNIDGSSKLALTIPDVPVPNGPGKGSDRVHWSPNGKWLLVKWTVCEAPRNYTARFLLVDRATGNMTEVYRSPSFDMSMSYIISEPEWSKSGDFAGITVVSRDAVGNWSTVPLLLDAKSGQMKPLAPANPGTTGFAYDLEANPPAVRVISTIPDANGRTLEPVDRAGAAHGTGSAAPDRQFTILKLLDKTGVVLDEFDLAPVLTADGFDLSRGSIITARRSVPGTGRWLLRVANMVPADAGQQSPRIMAWSQLYVYDADTRKLERFADDAGVTRDTDWVFDYSTAQADIWAGRLVVTEKGSSSRTLGRVDPVAMTAVQIGTVDRGEGMPPARIIAAHGRVFIVGADRVEAIELSNGRRTVVYTAPAGQVLEAGPFLGVYGGEYLILARYASDAPVDKPAKVWLDALSLK